MRAICGLMLAVGAQEIMGHRRHKRARENERADQREHDGFRQRPEQIAGDAAELKHRREHDVEHEQRDEGRHDDLLCAVQDRELDRFAHFQVVEDVFQRNGAFVDQHADGERKPAECHHIDCFAQRRERYDGKQDRERDGNDDDDRRPPTAKE